MIEDATLAARARLRGRLDALECEARHLTSGVIAGRLDLIRRDARDQRLGVAEQVCGGFARALASDGRGALIGGWFAALSDALACAEADEDRAAQACVAAVMVRLA